MFAGATASTQGASTPEAGGRGVRSALECTGRGNANDQVVVGIRQVVHAGVVWDAALVVRSKALQAGPPGLQFGRHLVEALRGAKHARFAPWWSAELHAHR